MYKKDGKKYPFEIDEYYSVALNSLKRVYTQHPKFNGNVRLIYELLLDHWNAEYGYAFPDHWELAIESGLSISTVKRSIGVLEQLELVKKRRSPIGGKKNNVYYLNKPVTTLEEFYKKFPEIKEKSKNRIAAIRAERERDMKKWNEDEKKGEPYAQPQRNYTVFYSKNKEEEGAPSNEERDLSAWF